MFCQNTQINYHFVTLYPDPYSKSPPPSPSHICGAVRVLPLIMFEIRLCFFHTLKMQRGVGAGRQIAKGACFRNIYYPIKMGLAESSNYLQTVCGMMNVCVGFAWPNSHLSLVCWRSAPIHTLCTPLYLLESGVYFRVHRSVWLSDGLSVCKGVERIINVCWSVCVCFP